MTEARPKPLLLLDVDGVLNPFSAGVVPDGFTEHRLAGMRVLVARRHGEWLNDLASAFELVWATTWEADANALIGPLIGLPPLPFIAFTPPEPTYEGYTQKLPDVIAFVGDRPLAWVDDLIGTDEQDWATRRSDLGLPTLLVTVDPRMGLMEAHVHQVRDFGTSLRGSNRDPGDE